MSFFCCTTGDKNTYCKSTVISAKLLEHSRHLGISSYFLSLFSCLFCNEYWSSIMSKRLQEDTVGGTQRNKIRSLSEVACCSLVGETDTFTHQTNLRQSIKHTEQCKTRLVQKCRAGMIFMSWRLKFYIIIALPPHLYLDLDVREYFLVV